MKADIRGSPVMGMDETVVQVLHEPGRSPSSESRMWVARGFAGKSNPGPVIWFEYADSRAGKVAESIAGDFRGYLQTDGYGGYSHLGKREGMVHVGCWAHIRREFHRLYRSDKESPLARQALHLIGKLYAVERRLRQPLEDKSLDHEGFVAARKDETSPIFAEILDWLHMQADAVPPASAMGQAVSYALGQFRRAIRYVDHWLMTPDNNPVRTPYGRL